VTSSMTTLELPRCEMKGQHAERLAGLLAQGPALAQLDLSGNYIFGAVLWGWKLAGVLAQCPALAHLNLSGNDKFGAEGQRGLQECWRSAQRWLTSATIRSQLSGQGDLSRLWTCTVGISLWHVSGDERLHVLRRLFRRHTRNIKRLL
jgi:hypothetical protein